jgi:hypothetical protein
MNQHEDGFRMGKNRASFNVLSECPNVINRDHLLGKTTSVFVAFERKGNTCFR